MESDLSRIDSQITEMKSQIDSDKATLKRMEWNHDQGYQVDTDLYEVLRQRHNSEVQTYNGLISEYNTRIVPYKRLLASTNAQIDRYNMLVRSR